MGVVGRAGVRLGPAGAWPPRAGYRAAVWTFLALPAAADPPAVVTRPEVSSAVRERMATNPCGPSLESSCVCAHLCAGTWPAGAETRVSWPLASGSTEAGAAPLGLALTLVWSAEGVAVGCGQALPTEAPPACPPRPAAPAR